MDPNASLLSGGPPRSIYYDPVENITGEDDGQLCKLNNLIKSSASGTSLLSCVSSTQLDWDFESSVGGLFVALTVSSAIYSAYTMLNTMDVKQTLSINIQLIMMTLLGSSMISMVVVYLTRRSAALVVYTSAASVPIGLVAGGGYMCKLYIQTFNEYLILPSVLMLLMGLYMLSRFARARHREAMDSTVSIINAACDTLCGAKDVYLVSGLFAVALLGYFYIWMETFWRMPKTMLNVVGAAVMLLWTQGVLETWHRLVIGNIATVSYFDSGKSDRSAIAYLCNTKMKQFGQVCIVGLFRFWWKMVRLGIYGYKNVIKLVPSNAIRLLLGIPGVGLVSVVEGWSFKLSDHALYYSCINPNANLLQSARLAIRIFRRNLIIALLTHTSSTLLLYLLSNASVVIIGCLFSLYLHDFTTACVCGLIGYGTTEFFSSILTATIDASLVCYAVDLDKSKLHRPKLHQAFSNRLSIIRQSNLQ